MILCNFGTQRTSDNSRHIRANLSMQSRLNVRFSHIVNSELFAKVVFSRHFADAKFRENENPREIA